MAKLWMKEIGCCEALWIFDYQDTAFGASISGISKEEMRMLATSNVESIFYGNQCMTEALLSGEMVLSR